MSVVLTVLRVQQPIGEFYVGAVDSRVLNSIATVDVREFKDDRAQDIAGIQRPLSKERLRKISEYVNFDFATFPTSVVLAVDERNVALEPIENCDGTYRLSITDFPGDEFEKRIPLDEAAFIIDGQHRLAGLDSLDADKSFEVNVSIFIGADLADRAEIFSTVNLAQTKVNRSLVYDLFSYAGTQSPFKMAHEVTIALDHDAEGPFHRKIKRLGVATPGRGKTETLSQATVVRGLLRHMPRHPDRERNKGILGLSRKAEPGEDWRVTIFAPFYRDGDDVSVFNIVTNYFSAVRHRWTTAWTDAEEGFVLNRTNGYNALIRFLQEAYLRVCEKPRVPSEDEFREIFSSMQIESADFVVGNFPPGSSGASTIFKALMAGRRPD